MGKVIGRIYEYYQRNWPYPSQNTSFFIPPHFDVNIPTQCNSASDTSVDKNDVASSVLDKSTNHHGNADDKDNDDSQSYETPQKNNFRSSSSGDTITTTTTPLSPTLPPHEK